MNKHEAIEFGESRLGLFGGKMEEFIELSVEALKKQDKEQQSEDTIKREDALMCMTGEYVTDMTYKPEDIISKHIRRLRALPSILPKPKTGHWILTDDDLVYCSECEDSYYSRPIDASWYYCPHCGAKMIEMN